jgi:hypothetical protein
MNNEQPLDIVSRALPGLHALSDEARQELHEAERGHPIALEVRLPAILEQLYRAVLLTLEVAGLREARKELIKRWSAATRQGVGHMEPNEYYDGSYSPPFGVLYSALRELTAIVGRGLDPIDDFNLRRFEQTLRRTAELIHRRCSQPSSEADVHKIMDDYLHAAFVDYTSQVQVPGVLKNFRPDGGVHSLKAAVEFKFATSPQEVRVALSGVLEDTAGYRGSSDWVHFYSVVYMTGPFESEERFAADLRRARAASWTPILVNGATTGSQRRKTNHRKRNRR